MWYYYPMTIKDENNLAKWVKTTIAFEDYKSLKKLAVDMNISLAELLRRILNLFLKELKKGGRITLN